MELHDITSARFESALAYEGLPVRAMFRSWAAELAPFPNRWRRAARVAFVTAIGAGIMATLQIANPLGLTLLVSLAAPEFTFNLATGVVFLLMAAIIPMLALFTVGALADSPVLLLSTFIVFTAISTYLIYGVRRLGRLWLWIQIPSVTAFYMVLFDRRSLGWDNAQMFAGTAIAVTLLLLSTRQAVQLRGTAALLASVMVAERIHSEVERLCVIACQQAGQGYEDERKRELRLAADALDGALGEYIVQINLSSRHEHAE